MKQLRFYLDAELLELVQRLQDFYQIKIRGSLLQYVLILQALDIANLPKNKNWSAMQRRCWLLCQKIKNDMGSVIARQAAKDVLTKHPATAEMSVHELCQLTKEKLVELAEGKGISTTGLQKSGIIRRLKNE